MENRWSDRRDLQLDVDVFLQGQMLFSCYSRDVGLGGAFLDLKTEQVLPKDADVKLVFHLFSGRHDTKHMMNARVVRVDNDGVGLKFHDFDTNVFRSLQEIMCYRVAEVANGN